MPPSVRTGLRTVALRTSFKMPVSVETILETPSLETPAFRVYRPVYLALFTRLCCYSPVTRPLLQSTVSLVTATGNQSLVTGGFAGNRLSTFGNPQPQRQQQKTRRSGRGGGVVPSEISTSKGKNGFPEHHRTP